MNRLQKSKARLTVMLCANMTGTDKRKLLIIGKSEKPRCLKNINIPQLGVTYRWNKKAWMLGNLFNEWLRQFDLSMHAAYRKILLFLDNCSAHQVTYIPKNIQVYFLPPNTTSSLQPMDQGIIRNLKCHYRGLLLQRYIAGTLYFVYRNWVDVDLSSLDQVENLIGTIIEKKLVKSKITNFFPML